MGLNITTKDKNKKTICDYERLGSYHTLHILREWLYINVEGNSEKDVTEFYSLFSDGKTLLKAEKFTNLLSHSDSDGGYKDYTFYKGKESWEWQDLNILRNELEDIKENYYNIMDENTKQVFDRFYEIINRKGSDGEKAVKVIFH